MRAASILRRVLSAGTTAKAPRHWRTPKPGGSTIAPATGEGLPESKTWRNKIGAPVWRSFWTAAVLCRFGTPFIAVLVFLTASLRADPPTLEAIYPPGAARGSTNAVSVSGKFDPWPPRVWISSAVPVSDQDRSTNMTLALDVTVTAETNKGKLTLIIASNAVPGPRLVRLFNEDGCSDPRIFVVGAGIEIAEVETNNQFANPQTIASLPITINGRLAKSGDVDCFGVHLNRGDWLEARVDSYTLMGKLDAVLRLVTTDGQQLAWNHDFATLDPRLVWWAMKDTNVVLQLFGFPYPANSDVRLYGNDAAIYRLHLTTTFTRPKILNGKPDEKEPNDSDRAATQITLPATVIGAIGSNTDEDRFRFRSKKDEVVEARVVAAAAGSPLDAWLTISDADGKQLARSDDADNSNDPVLEWKAPTNAVYTFTVGSLTHRGGRDYEYRLEVKPVVPDFRASLATSSLVLNQGATNSLKFKIKRLRGHTNDLTAVLTDLPAGVTATQTNVASKGGDFEIPIIAETNAPPFSGAIHLVVADTVTHEERRIALPLASRTEDNGVPGGYTDLLVDSIDHVWLTIRKKPDEPPKTAAAK